MDEDIDEKSDIFQADGVVAEMVIEVEDSPKSSEREQKCFSPTKVDQYIKQIAENNFSFEKTKNNSIFEMDLKESSISVPPFEDSKCVQLVDLNSSTDSIAMDKENCVIPSRFSGRKRVANRKYLEGNLEPTKIAKVEKEEPKEETKEVPKRGTIAKKRLREAVENEETRMKKRTLRKLPFRKNKDAPDIPDFKPNVFWWNGDGEGSGMRLRDIDGIRNGITEQGRKGLRTLYKVIFFACAKEKEDIAEKILNFNGFPFDKSSFEYVKRHKLLRGLVSTTIENMCETLMLPTGSKNTMIANILNFLLKPKGTLDPSKDPSMQPVVLLERLVLDKKFLKAAMRKSLREYACALKSEKDALNTEPGIRTRGSSLRKGGLRSSSASSKKDDEKTVLKNEESVKPPDSKAVASDAAEVKEDKSSDKKKMRIQKLKRIIRKLKRELEISKAQRKKDSSSNESLSDDSEITETADEEEENDYDDDDEDDFQMKSPEQSPSCDSPNKDKLTKKSFCATKKGGGKPLKSFPEIKASILKANFSSLQRLHILLFGDHDRAENLKDNILEFAGFPFEEGSKDWNQKKFLLSLWAKNTVKEYLKMLCIQCDSDDGDTMILKLMKFLAAPNKVEATHSKKDHAYHHKDTPPKKKTGKPPQKDSDRNDTTPKKKIGKSPKNDSGNKKNEKDKEKTVTSKKRYSISPEALKKVESSKEDTVNDNAEVHDVSLSPPQLRLQIPKPPPAVSDPSKLNALLQAVYKRRLLKFSGVAVDSLKKEETTCLGDIQNVKFLIVTSNVRDLEVLHHLLYLSKASRSKLRRNILDFDGFSFSEDSPSYKERMDFLNGLGYDGSKRISFLLGLCSLKTTICQQDLNELIMYFLMAPCKMDRQIPITAMPIKPSKSMKNAVLVPTEAPNVLLDNLKKMKSSSVKSPKSSAKLAVSSAKAEASSNPTEASPPAIQTEDSPSKSILKVATSTMPVLKLGTVSTPTSKVDTSPQTIPAQNKQYVLKPSASQDSAVIQFTIDKAPSKSVDSPNLSPVKKIVLPPFGSPLTTQFLESLSKSKTTAATPKELPKLSTPVNANKGLTLNSMTKLSPPVTGASQIQFQKVVTSAKNNTNSQAVVEPIVYLSPDGKKTTYKLIRLPGNHPLASAVKPSLPSNSSPPQTFVVSSPKVSQSHGAAQPSQQVTIGPKESPPRAKLSLAQMLFPNLSSLSTPKPASSTPHKVTPSVNSQSLQRAVPKLPTQQPPQPTADSSQSTVIWVPANALNNPILLKQYLAKVGEKMQKPESSYPVANTEEYVLPDEGESAALAATNELDSSEVEMMNPLEDNPPTDDEIFSSIQEIIHNANFEDITLRNVIDRVSAQFSGHDLTHKHNFMKECVKKIIIGT